MRSRPIACVAEPRSRDGARSKRRAAIDRVVPAGRRYRLRLRVARPSAVAVEGVGELPSTDGDAGGAGWWMDDAGFLCVRPPDRSTLTVVVD